MSRKVGLVILLIIALGLILYGCSGHQSGSARQEVNVHRNQQAVAKKAVPVASGEENLEKIRFVPVPILYYHAIDDNIFGIRELIASPAQFAEEMDYLDRNNYQPITFADLSRAYRYQKPVIITFDDGYADNYSHAYPILKKHHFKATIFMIAGAIGGGNYLKPEQIKEMSDLIDIQGHTMSHPDLTKVDQARLDYELGESQRRIEALTGRKVIAFSYPSGHYNRAVLAVTKHYYRYAVVTTRGIYRHGDDPYTIRRIYIPSGLSLRQFASRLKGGA